MVLNMSASAHGTPATVASSGATPVAGIQQQHDRWDHLMVGSPAAGRSRATGAVVEGESEQKRARSEREIELRDLINLNVSKNLPADLRKQVTAAVKELQEKIEKLIKARKRAEQMAEDVGKL